MMYCMKEIYANLFNWSTMKRLESIAGKMKQAVIFVHTVTETPWFKNMDTSLQRNYEGRLLEFDISFN